MKGQFINKKYQKQYFIRQICSCLKIYRRGRPFILVCTFPGWIRQRSTVNSSPLQQEGKRKSEDAVNTPWIKRRLSVGVTKLNKSWCQPDCFSKRPRIRFNSLRSVCEGLYVHVQPSANPSWESEISFAQTVEQLGQEQFEPLWRVSKNVSHAMRLHACSTEPYNRNEALCHDSSFTQRFSLWRDSEQ